MSENKNYNHDIEKEENIKIKENLDNKKNNIDTVTDIDQFDKDDIKENKIIAALSYLSILILIPIFAAQKSKYVNFHAKQGINLLVLSIIYSILSTIYKLFFTRKILYRVVHYSSPWFLSIILTILFVGIIILTIVGFVNAISGNTKKLPLIGNWKIIK